MAKERSRRKKPQDVPASESRSHPVGVGTGAAGGAIAGGLAGEGIARALNPVNEDAYWHEHYSERPYIAPGTEYATYQPAYRYGWEATERHHGRSFDEIEPDLRRDWERRRGGSSLRWEQAMPGHDDATER